MTFLILIVPYDGFAIRAEDTKEATQENPVEFEVIGEIGRVPFLEEVELLKQFAL